jgi:hypothetical protein
MLKFQISNAKNQYELHPTLRLRYFVHNDNATLSGCVENISLKAQEGLTVEKISSNELCIDVCAVDCGDI